MYMTWVYYCLAASFASIACLIITSALLNLYAYVSFKKKSKGVPMLGDYGPISTHVNSVMFKEYVMPKLSAEMQKLRSKTCAIMYGKLPVVISYDLELIKRVLVDEKAINRTKLNMPLKEVEVDSLMLAENDQWRRIRKVFAPALKSSKFKTPNMQKCFDDSLNKVVRAIETQLDKSEDGEVELFVDDLAHRYSLDLVLSCFYKQNDLINFNLDKPDPMCEVVDEGLVALMASSIARVGFIFPILAPLIDWLSLNFTTEGVWRKLITTFVQQQTKINLEARKQIQRSKVAGKLVDEDNLVLDSGVKFSRTMIDHIIDQFHDGKLTKREYFHSSWFLLGAADKTAADSLVYTIYQLAVNQEVQAILRQSIRAHGPESEYLTWVINESLRLLPPAAIGCSRMIERDLEYKDGIFIPAKTFLLTQANLMHRDPDYWGPDADQFKPKRWAKSGHFHPLQFIPFGAGSRICPGKEFAMHEMQRLLCVLVTRYKFHCEPMENRWNLPIFIYVLPEKFTYVTLTRAD